MKAAWRQVEEAFPHVTPICCAAHGLNLLLGDIMGLETMQTLYNKAYKVVEYVKGKWMASAMFREKQCENQKNTSLKLPCKTRWGSSVIMCTSLLVGKVSLQDMAISESIEINSTIKKTFLEYVFWEHIDNNLTILTPIASAINQLEGDGAVLSDV